MSERQRNTIAVFVVVGALAGAALLWPKGPTPIDDAWLIDPRCEPVDGGVEFAASLQVPDTLEDQQLRAELRSLSVMVEAHEGGRAVASAETRLSLASPSQTASFAAADDAAATAADVRVVVPTGNIKSPTCRTTLLGHR